MPKTLESAIKYFVLCKLNIRLYDIKGKIILEGAFEKQGNELSIPFDGFNSGTYLLKVGNNNTNTFKVLKR